MARGPASSRSGMPVPPRVEVEALEGVLPVARRTEAHVSLPGQRLDQRARALVEDRLQVPVRPVPGQHVAELGDGQRSVAQRLAHRGSEVGPVRWGEPVVLHPARQLPLPPGRPEGEIDAAVLGREVVHRPAERERLDDLPSASAFASSPGRDVVRRVRTASSASDSSIDSTAPSRRTTSATDSDPTGSSSCRSIRQASACAHVTDASLDVFMPAASQTFRTKGVRYPRPVNRRRSSRPGLRSPARDARRRPCRSCAPPTSSPCRPRRSGRSRAGAPVRMPRRWRSPRRGWGSS